MPDKKSIVAILLLSLLFSACTSIPKSETPVSAFGGLDCSSLKTEFASAKKTEAIATQAKKDSWKVILPIGIGARYLYSSSSLKEAEEREKKLGEELKRKDCPTESY
ncbi:hypothetical protein [Collimonas silvisoli]|uniref:hypothetical protein n=1 Tax=Collimonas silvisoli TaxID=2825884 RepID=UPI001B8BFA9B|nr:hypothetical protein [Collimonas silvisoli]